MKQPAWGARPDDPRATALLPVSYLYALGCRVREALSSPWVAAVPTLCVGNASCGGAGKTPLTMFLADMLLTKGKHVALASKGYGGKEKGPLLVDPKEHGARHVGDEALLLAARAPLYVGKNRVATLKAALGADPDVMICDDGMQNPTFHKDITLLVESPEYRPVSHRLFPAGPWRMSPAKAAEKANARALIYYRDSAFSDGDADEDENGPPIFRFRFAADFGELDVSRPCVAFAGIGTPQKFFDALSAAGIRLVDTFVFPDHHPYGPTDEDRLLRVAEAEGAMLATTEKDFVRLSESFRAYVRFAPGRLHASERETERFYHFIENSLREARARRERGVL